MFYNPSASFLGTSLCTREAWETRNLFILIIVLLKTYFVSNLDKRADISPFVQITDKVCFQKHYYQNEQIASFPSLPCAKGGAEERGGGIVKHINSIKKQSLSRFATAPFTQGSLFVLCKLIDSFYMVRFVSSQRRAGFPALLCFWSS